ncbi:virulence factor Mce family protein [Mycobacterium sp. CVI_P3]|uniref:Virulence factor Mce family protein n=1 Tax=Mycobacterium pinniadriaticum TaxID=2994102 RepID=A0ABT3SPB4_9MYCO|nr:virulence factor Mce family protein [Mycobacterium pinniadriaticum]MCX2934750.1 virulence factor Mce family protein [Mycobacterium pinniadriaticum]MCX2941172.1 virulence factor Mce family protein [Mycobacterium pinniadriaticum]
MRDNLGAAIWRLTAFMVVCALGTFGLLMVFAQLRFQDENVFKADFTNVSGLESGDFVRIAGVEVGKVKRISINADNLAVVEFSADDSVVLTEGTKALIRYDNLIGGRYLELKEGAGGVKRLNPGQEIPADRTEPALDLDALIGGFRPLFRALDPQQVNALSTQLIQAFQGQGAAIGSFLTQTASFTSTLADRDEVVGQVITNLNVVLGSLGDQSKQFDTAVDSLAQLVEGLAARKTDISNGLAAMNSAASSVADLFSQAREPFKNVVAQSDRANSIVVADHEYVDNLINTLPDAYQALGRLGLNGDFFTFYLCDAVLKVNGKGGQPVYIKVAGQDTGRCAPR